MEIGRKPARVLPDEIEIGADIAPVLLTVWSFTAGFTGVGGGDEVMAGSHETQTRDRPEEKEISQSAFKQYWRANLTLMGILLAIWFAVSFGAGIVFRDFLDQWSIGGAPLGFWFAQQGAIYVFVILIFVYSAVMHRIEQRFDVDDDEG